MGSMGGEERSGDGVTARLYSVREHFNIEKYEIEPTPFLLVYYCILSFSVCVRALAARRAGVEPA